MDKMRMESIDMTAQNIEKIGALFPNCITETKGADGKPKKVINFDLLRQMLSCQNQCNADFQGAGAGHFCESAVRRGSV